MKVSGSHVEIVESMSQNVFSIRETQIIQSTTEKLSKEGKHVINIIHGTPSSVLGTVKKTLTFLWEADDEDEVYKKVEERKKQAIETRQRLERQIAECEQTICLLKSRIHAAENVVNPVEARKKSEKTNTVEEILYPILGVVFSVIFFFAAAVLHNEGSFIFVILGLITLWAGGMNLYNGVIKKMIKPEEYKREKEGYLRGVEQAAKNALQDKENLQELRAQLTSAESKLMELRRALSFYKD